MSRSQAQIPTASDAAANTGQSSEGEQSGSASVPPSTGKKPPSKRKPDPVDRIDTTKADTKKKEAVLDFYYTQMKDDQVNFKLKPAMSSDSSKTSSSSGLETSSEAAKSFDGYKAVFTVTRADPSQRDVLDVSKFISNSEAANFKITNQEIKSKYYRVVLTKVEKKIDIGYYFTPDSPNQTSSDEDTMEVEYSKPLELTD